MHSRRNLAILIFVSIIAIFLTLFQHFETSGETWVYWMFSRVFSESGKFIIIQRSPPYTIYLALFRMLGFPLSVSAEYVVTSLFTVLCITALFKSYLGLPISFLAALIWIPYMQVSEPPVQKIALALSCLAVYLRQKNSSRFHKSLFYALLGLAFMFRPTYIFAIGIFWVSDLIRFLSIHKKEKFAYLIPQPRHDWPIFVVISLYIIFQTFQSPLPNNNIFSSSTTKWFPQNSKSEEIIQNYNWTYISEKYKTFVGHDFYTTNRELFGGATDTLGAIRNNPKYVISHIFIFAGQAIPMIAKMTNLAPLGIFLLLFVLSTAFLGARDAPMRVFIMANVVMTAATIAFMPQYRYLIFPVIPLFILASKGFGLVSVYFLTRIVKMNKHHLLLPTMTAVFLIVLSPNFAGVNYYNRSYLDWIALGKNIINDAKKKDLRIMDVRSSYFNSSMKESIGVIYTLIKNCKGIMTLESTFFGAFTDIPINKIYDVWEIPPFGRLGDSEYSGLNPDRINCILVSRELALYEGFATNYQIRYQNYIQPYIEKLLSLGAKSYDVTGYGRVVILK